jgi:hypothetical protein
MIERQKDLGRKAFQYERAAGIATDPDAWRAYLDLSRQLWARAEQAEAFERVGYLRQGIWWPAPVCGDDGKSERRDITA